MSPVSCQPCRSLPAPAPRVIGAHIAVLHLTARLDSRDLRNLMWYLPELDNSTLAVRCPALFFPSASTDTLRITTGKRFAFAEPPFKADSEDITDSASEMTVFVSIMTLSKGWHSRNASKDLAARTRQHNHNGSVGLRKALMFAALFGTGLKRDAHIPISYHS